MSMPAPQLRPSLRQTATRAGQLRQHDDRQHAAGGAIGGV